MQGRGLGPAHLVDRQGAERREDVVPQRSPVDPRGVGVAVHRDVRLHVPLRQAGHGRHGLGLRRRRILALLDAVDDVGRSPARLVGGELAVPAQGDAPGSVRSPALHDVDLAARGIDPHTEPGQVPVPEDGVSALGRERVDGAFGDRQVGLSGHRLGFRHPVIIPQSSGIEPKRMNDEKSMNAKDDYFHIQQDIITLMCIHMCMRHR